MKVLVVDDDTSVRESVSKVLNEEGYDAVLAADGNEALKQFATHKIDLLLLDLGLPIKSGWDVFEQITTENPFVSIIIITGQADQYRVAGAAGVGALMEKPLDVPQLLQTIQDLLAEPKETRLRRLCGQGGEVRHIPASTAALLKRLREQSEKLDRFKLPHPHKFR